MFMELNISSLMDFNWIWISKSCSTRHIFNTRFWEWKNWAYSSTASWTKETPRIARNSSQHHPFPGQESCRCQFYNQVSDLTQTRVKPTTSRSSSWYSTNYAISLFNTTQIKYLPILISCNSCTNFGSLCRYTCLNSIHFEIHLTHDSDC